MKRFLGVKSLLIVVFFAATCLAFFPVMASAAEKVITLNYSNFFPAPHKNSIIAQDYCKEIEKRTGGKVKITYFPGGTLTPAAQTYDNVVKGIADIGESCFAYTRGKFPMMEVIDLPLGYKTGTAATQLINDFYAKYQPKELSEVKVLWLHAHGPGILLSKKPVKTMADLKGMKVRATGLAAKVVQALGAAPVGTTMGETYDALRTGVADAAMAPVEAAQGWKWAEVIKSITQNFGSAYTTGMFIVMNKAKWNSLPDDVKKVFEDVSKEYIAKQGKLWDDIDKEGYAYNKKLGNGVIALSAAEDAKWAAAVKPLLDEHEKTLKSKGLPAEAVKYAVDSLKKIQK